MDDRIREYIEKFEQAVAVIRERIEDAKKELTSTKWTNDFARKMCELKIESRENLLEQIIVIHSYILELKKK